MSHGKNNTYVFEGDYFESQAEVQFSWLPTIKQAIKQLQSFIILDSQQLDYPLPAWVKI